MVYSPRITSSLHTCAAARRIAFLMRTYFSPRRFLVLFVFFCLSCNIRAAEFEFAGIDKPACEKIEEVSNCASIAMMGRIDPGDARKLQQEIEKIESALGRTMGTTRVGHIFLESPGGNMLEAMTIGRLIRRKQIATQVEIGNMCASACVLVLASGAKRIPGGDVVIHSFYSPELLGSNDFATTEKFYEQMANTVGAYLKEMRVSSMLLEEMIRIPHFKQRRLEIDELVKLGLLGLDPAYAQAKKPPSQAQTVPPKK